MSIFFLRRGNEWFSLDLGFYHRLVLSGMYTLRKREKVCVCSCVMRERESGRESEGEPFSSKRIISPLVAACQPVWLTGCCHLLARFHISSYLCSLEMSEGFFLASKTDKLELNSRSLVSYNCYSFLYCFQTIPCPCLSLNIWAIRNSDKWAEKQP